MRTPVLTTLTTEPFTCPSCVKKISTALKRLPGIESVDVGFSSSRVKVRHDAVATTVEQLAAVVTDLGYPVLGRRSAAA